MKKILIYNSGGGLGDAIQLFTLIISLKNHFSKSDFYYIGAHENHYQNKLKEFNLDLKTVDLDLQYFGFRWWHLFIVKKKILEKKINKFDLIIDVQSKLRNTLIVKQIPCINFFSTTFKFIFCSKKNKYLNNESDLSSNILSNLKLFLNLEIKKIDYDLKLLPIKYINEAKRLLPGKNYIGFSVTQGNKYRLKSWPIQNFIDLAGKHTSSGKNIVFFIEKSEIELINKIKKKLPNAIFPENNSKLNCPALITALSSRLEKAVTIDNGVMHMMALAKIPMVTLFGPTSSKKFSPKMKNVKILDSKNLYRTTNISRITVEDVFSCF
jgi:ADP-heptose:LPS heptosyltransferase